MNKLIFSLAATLVSESVSAQATSGTVSPSNGATATPTQVQQRRSDLRQALAPQAAAPATGSIGERRLSPQEKLELRQLLRLQGQGGAGGMP